jgi:glycosyltransferase involved in cell wall biosynthesis
VIGGAPSTALEVGPDATERRARLALPERYVITMIEGDPGNGFARLAAAEVGVPVVVLAGSGDATAVEGAEKFTVLENLEPADVAAALAGSLAFVQPSIAAGFGAASLDAMSLGVPVVATDLPALREMTAGAAVLVGDDDDLGDAVRGLVEDERERDHVAVAGADRAKAFSWRDAAEKIWQLHADL